MLFSSHTDFPSYCPLPPFPSFIPNEDTTPMQDLDRCRPRRKMPCNDYSFIGSFVCIYGLMTLPVAVVPTTDNTPIQFSVSPPRPRRLKPQPSLMPKRGYKHSKRPCSSTPAHTSYNASTPTWTDYAPSLPNSFVQSALLLRSSPLTVGLDALIALMKSLTLSGGSRS